MSDFPSFLPALILLNDFGGDWDAYLEAIYGVFKKDFIDSRPHYDGRRVGIKRFPMDRGKEATFWHLISEGTVELDRIPDLRRCERISWPRPMIEIKNPEGIKIWKNTSRGGTRVVIALEDFSYIVVLAERNDYLLLWTAYFVEKEHRRRKLQKDYRESTEV